VPGRRSHLAHGTGHDNRSTDKLGGRAACWHVPGVRALQSRSSASRDVATVPARATRRVQRPSPRGGLRRRVPVAAALPCPSPTAARDRALTLLATHPGNGLAAAQLARLDGVHALFPSRPDEPVVLLVHPGGRSLGLDLIEIPPDHEVPGACAARALIDLAPDPCGPVCSVPPPSSASAVKPSSRSPPPLSPPPGSALWPAPRVSHDSRTPPTAPGSPTISPAPTGPTSET
jgi:hypothetical protein